MATVEHKGKEKVKYPSSTGIQHLEELVDRGIRQGQSINLIPNESIIENRNQFESNIRRVDAGARREWTSLMNWTKSITKFGAIRYKDTCKKNPFTEISGWKKATICEAGILNY